MNKTIALLSFIFLLACTNKEKNNSSNIHTIKVVEAKGYVVPKDSMAEPKVILVDESKLKKIPVGKPTVIPTNTNVHIAGDPKIVLAGKPRICTPGQGTFLLPKTVPAIDSSFVAGIPEIVIAKDRANKDQNPQNFSTYGQLQGLKHGVIHCITQDKSGNIWFGTVAGVSKYDGKSFTHFTDKEGLGNNQVLSILEDKSGSFWFGTLGGGVSKYDGKRFTHFTDKEGLSDNDVLSILEDKSGNLWFGTEGGGVSKYDGKRFTHFTDKEGLSNNDVYSMLEDKSGNLWFGTWGGGACKYDGQSFTHFTDKEGLGNNFVFDILEDKSGNLWFGTWGGGACKYDGQSFTHFTDKEGLGNNDIMNILEDKSGNLWFGTWGGISKYDGKRFTHFTDKEGLIHNYVRSSLEDKSGNLWFGTIGGGVSKYDGKSFTHFNDKEGLSDNDVWSILEDKSGNLWLGTNGSGVSKYDGKSFTHFTNKEGLSNNFVISILEDKSGNLWFATADGVCKYDGKSFTHFTDKEGLINNNVWSILEDKSGNLWFGTAGGACKYDGKSFTHFTNKEGLSNNFVISILEDKSGNLWFEFGISGGGVSKYDGKGFTHFTDKEGLIHNSVTSILEDKNGNLWFGTTGGVCKYDGKSFTHFTDKEGLIHNSVISILEDKSGNLWFGTLFGLSKLTRAKQVKINHKIKSNSLSKQDIIFKNYTYTDGFLGIGVNGVKAMLQAKDGTIWIGANDRLTAMHPENMPPDFIAPNIQLTSIELFNENIAWLNLENNKDTTFTLGNGISVSNFNFDGLSKWYSLPQNLSLAYNNNYLTFNFIGITMNQPQNVKYRYKLEGLDENWSAITNKTSASYGNLPHGTYTFKVKAMNSEGIWSAPFEYKFTIRPPFWKTWWFRTLIGLIIIGSIVFYIKWRERTLKERQKILETKVEEATFEIKEQKHLIEEKHKEITDSINYAERIQRSFLATKQILDENLNDYFLFFKPKDVVSGDFYWAAKLKNNQFSLMCADSTGHGVPGAIMSLLNITSIELAVKDGFEKPSDILNETRKSIIERLKKDGSIDGGKDGMDGSLLNFDFQNNVLHCATAHNPVWIVRDKEIVEIKADRYPIGKHDRDKESFTLHEIDLQKGDVVYTFTDGFADQFGGPAGKKFKYKKLQELLLSISDEPMLVQKQKINEVFDSWKGNLEQVDDVTIVGVKIF